MAGVVPPALLLFAQTGLVAVVPDSRPGGCPTAEAVEQALYARVPGAVIPFGEAKRRGALQLGLTISPSDGRRGFTLVDAAGRPRLSRALGALPAGKEAETECVALAETTALIVQRYLTEFDDALPEPPKVATPLPISIRPPPGPDRRWDMAAVTGWRVGNEVWGGLEVGVRVLRLMGTTGRILIAAGAGIGGTANAVPPGSEFDGTAAVRHFPAELGLWWRTVTWRTELQLGAGGGLDLTHVSARGSGGSATELLPGPMLFGAAALRVPLRGRTFTRVSAGVAANIVTYRFFYKDQSKVDGVTIFSVPTHRFYARIAAEFGFTLR